LPSSTKLSSSTQDPSPGNIPQLEAEDWPTSHHRGKMCSSFCSRRPDLTHEQKFIIFETSHPTLGHGHGVHSRPNHRERLGRQIESCPLAAIVPIAFTDWESSYSCAFKYPKGKRLPVAVHQQGYHRQYKPSPSGPEFPGAAWITSAI